MSKNNLEYISYPDNDVRCGDKPFESLQCLLLGIPLLGLIPYLIDLSTSYGLLYVNLYHASGGNKIADLASVDSLNSFPNLRVSSYTSTFMCFYNLGGITFYF